MRRPALLVPLALLATCENDHQETEAPVETITEFLKASTNVRVAPSSVPTDGGSQGYGETALVAIPISDGGTTGSVVVALYNAYAIQQGAGLGWATTQDQVAWTAHLQNDSGFDWAWPVGETPSPGGTFNGWQADPGLVPTGYPDQVAATALTGSSASVGIGTDVSISLSMDRGVHFTSTHILTTPDSGIVVDGPTAAFNPATKHIWVFWRQANQDQSNKTSWIQQVHYDDGGAFYRDGPSIEVTGLTEKAFYGKIQLAGIVDGGAEAHLFLAFANQANPQNICTYFDPIWYFARSNDQGKHWSTYKLAEDTTWPTCVTTDSQGHVGQDSNKLQPGFACDPVSGDCFEAFDVHSPSGTRIKVYKIAGGAPFLLGGTLVFTPNRPTGDEFGAAVAFQHTSGFDAGTVAVYWRDASDDPDGGGVTIWAALSTDQGSTWGMARVTPLANASVPFLQRDTSDVTNDWGDYESLADNSYSQNFMAAWGDNRNGDTQIWSSVLQPDCLGISSQGCGNAVESCCDPRAQCDSNTIDAGVCCLPEHAIGCAKDLDCCGNSYNGGGICVDAGLVVSGGNVSECETHCTFDSNCSNNYEACPVANSYCCTDAVGFVCASSKDCCSRGAMPCSPVSTTVSLCCKPDGGTCTTDTDCCTVDQTGFNLETIAGFCYPSQPPTQKTCQVCRPAGYTLSAGNLDAGAICCTHTQQQVGTAFKCCAPLGSLYCVNTSDCCTAGGNVICGGIGEGDPYGWCCRTQGGSCVTNADCCGGWCHLNYLPDGGGMCDGLGNNPNNPCQK